MNCQFCTPEFGPLFNFPERHVGNANDLNGKIFLPQLFFYLNDIFSGFRSDPDIALGDGFCWCYFGKYFRCTGTYSMIPSHYPYRCYGRKERPTRSALFQPPNKLVILNRFLVKLDLFFNLISPPKSIRLNAAEALFDFHWNAVSWLELSIDWFQVKLSAPEVANLWAFHLYNSQFLLLDKSWNIWTSFFRLESPIWGFMSNQQLSENFWTAVGDDFDIGTCSISPKKGFHLKNLLKFY